MSHEVIAYSLSVQLQFCTGIIRGYHIAVFISARISNPCVDNCSGQLSTEGLKIWGRFENSRVRTSLSYDRTICQRISYFICCNSLLVYAESNWWMIDRLQRRLYITGPSASCNNQSELFVTVHDTWKFKLSYAVYRRARTDISPWNFHLCHVRKKEPMVFYI